MGAAPRARLAPVSVGAAPRARYPPPLWEQHPVRDLLVDHKPHRAQGAAPTGKLPLPSWEEHPVRDLLVDPNPIARRARPLQIDSAKGHQEKVSTM